MMSRLSADHASPEIEPGRNGIRRAGPFGSKELESGWITRPPLVTGKTKAWPSRAREAIGLGCASGGMVKVRTISPDSIDSKAHARGRSAELRVATTTYRPSGDHPTMLLTDSASL